MKRHPKLTRSERYRHETERALARMLARATRGSGSGFGCRLMSLAGYRAKPASRRSRKSNDARHPRAER